MTATGRVTASPAPPSRRRDFGQYGLCSARLRLVFLLDQPSAAVGFISALRLLLPSIHMRCRITPILRAKATFARFEPRRLATSIPQRLSFENRVIRDSRTLAAS